MDMSSVRPLGDRVLVRRDDAETVSKGGIVLPIQAQEQRLTGVVVAVGPGRINERGVRVEPLVRNGDRVLFGKYAGQDHEDRFVILREDDLIGVVAP